MGALSLLVVILLVLAVIQLKNQEWFRWMVDLIRGGKWW
jgi:hypothetical protein